MRHALMSTALGAVLALGFATADAAAQSNLRVGAVELPPSRGNPFGGSGTPGIFTWSMLYDALTLVDTRGLPTPALATEWRNIDPRTWTFKMKPGVKFDNGEASDANTVVETINWLKTDAGKAQVVGREAANIASVRAIDAATVEIKTVTPDAILPSRIANIYFVAPKAWKDMGMENYANKPSGTGSFRVATWSAEKVTLAGRNDSWRNPKIPGVEVVSLPERASRTQALLSGQLDLAVGMDTSDIKAIRGSGNEVAVAGAPQILALSMPNKVKPNSPLNDKRVRQAMILGVNREGIAEGIFQGQTRATGQGATQSAFGYNPNIKPHPYDPERAKKLLAEAGHAGGFKMVAEVVVGSFAGDSEMYQQMAQDLSKIGVQVELRPVRFPDWLRKYQTNAWDGDAFGLSWQLGPYMDSIRGLSFYSCAQKPVVFFCDEDTQKLIDGSNQEFDRSKREKMLQQVWERYYDLVPSLYLVEAIDVYGLSRRVSGFRDVNRTLMYHEIMLTR